MSTTMIIIYVRFRHPYGGEYNAIPVRHGEALEIRSADDNKFVAEIPSRYRETGGISREEINSACTAVTFARVREELRLAREQKDEIVEPEEPPEETEGAPDRLFL